MTTYRSDETNDQIYERQLRGALQDITGSIQIADKALSSATRALDTLTGDLYDIELVEGPDAHDIQHELRVAARAFRNVTRAVQLRTALLDSTPPGVPGLQDWRDRSCTIEAWERAVAGMTSKERERVLAAMFVDEVEALLEHSFLSGDPVYRDQVIARLAEIDPARAAGPKRAAAERDRARAES